MRAPSLHFPPYSAPKILTVEFWLFSRSRWLPAPGPTFQHGKVILGSVVVGQRLKYLDWGVRKELDSTPGSILRSWVP